MELSHCSPRLEKLRNLLHESPYGKEKDNTLVIVRFVNPSNLQYTLADLKEKIQASDAELRLALANLHAAEIDGLSSFFSFSVVAEDPSDTISGYMRVLDLEYAKQTGDLLIATIIYKVFVACICL